MRAISPTPVRARWFTPLLLLALALSVACVADHSAPTRSSSAAVAPITADHYAAPWVGSAKLEITATTDDSLTIAWPACHCSPSHRPEVYRVFVGGKQAALVEGGAASDGPRTLDATVTASASLPIARCEASEISVQLGLRETPSSPITWVDDAALFTRGGPAGDPLAVDARRPAGALDPSLSTDIAQAGRFLYTAEPGSKKAPRQTPRAGGAALQDVLSSKTLAVVQGKIRERGSPSPILCAKVEVVGHPELGETSTGPDGSFALAVNGGQTLTLKVSKPGYLSVERQVLAPANAYAWAEDAVMVRPSAESALVTLSATSSVLARGTEEKGEGAALARRPLLLFRPGTNARATRDDGSKVDLSTFHLRTTELTVGADGRRAMPGELPANSAYTYAVDLRVDEASDATRVDFTNASPDFAASPVVFYLDNFLGLATATATPIGIPSGSFDDQKGAWVAEDNGRVVTITKIDGGRAVLDLDPATVASLHLTDDERAQLADAYKDKPFPYSVWRVPMTHFSRWDLNLGFSLKNLIAPLVPESLRNLIDAATCKDGSVIECQNQSLGENVALPSTPYLLHYQSNWQPGRGKTLAFSIAGKDGVPGDVTRVELEVIVAGHRYQVSKEGPSVAADESVAIEWDGTDFAGRFASGAVPVHARLCYWSEIEYVRVTALAYNPPADATTTEYFKDASGRPSEGRVCTSWSGVVDRWQGGPASLGGWTLDVHHTLDPKAQRLYRGDGTTREVQPRSFRVSTVIGGPRGYVEGSTSEARIDLIGGSGSIPSPPSVGLAIAPDGTIYFGDRENGRIRKIVAGRTSVVAGNGTRVSTPEELVEGSDPVTASVPGAGGVSLGPDGSVFLTDRTRRYVRQIRGGAIYSFAGAGSDDGVATFDVRTPPKTALVYRPIATAVAPDGAVFLSEYWTDTASAVGARVDRVGTDGQIIRWAGKAGCTFAPAAADGERTRATDVCLRNPAAIALAPDGSLYIADSGDFRIRKVDAFGYATTFAGKNTSSRTPEATLPLGDGGPATDASLESPHGVAVGPDGAVYIADSGHHCIRRVAEGVITTFAGKCDNERFAGAFVDGVDARSARFNFPTDLAFGPDGALYVADIGNNRIRKVAPELGQALGVTEVGVPSDDGHELYVFDARGRHQRTLDTLTGSVLLQFSYDGAGAISSIRDADGHSTRFDRSTPGQVKVVAPYGQLTTLTLGGGSLTKLANAAGEEIQLAYDAGGLLTTLVDPRGKTHSFTYDDSGRLRSDMAPGSGEGSSDVQNLALAATGRTARAWSVTYTSGEGLDTRHDVSVDVGGRTTLTTTHASALVATRTIEPDGDYSVASPTGMRRVVAFRPDPRFGFDSPLASVVLTAPRALDPDADPSDDEARSLTLQRTRSVTPGAAGSLVSLEAFTQQDKVNGTVVSTLAYDKATATITETSAEGRTVAYTLDKDHPWRVIAIARPGLETVTLEYDAQGRATTSTASSRRTRRSFYDASNGVRNGFLKSVSAEKTTSPTPLESFAFTPDAVDRIKQVALPGSGRAIGLDYDPDSHLTGFTPPGRPQHAFDIHPSGLTSRYTPPRAVPSDPATSRSTSFDYDHDGRLVQETLADGQRVESKYEKTLGLAGTGAIRSLTAFDARGTKALELAFAYKGEAAGATEKTGQLDSIADKTAGNAVSFTYNGSLLTSESWAGVVSGSIAFTHDRFFRRASQTVTGAPPADPSAPTPSDAIAFVYDDDSALTRAGLLALTYDPGGKKNGLLWTTRLTTGDESDKCATAPCADDAFAYNGFGEVTSYAASYVSGGSAKPLYSTSITRDDLGRIQTRTEVLDGKTTPYDYEYYDEGWLKSVTTGGATVTFTYDKNGNRLTTTGIAGTATVDDQDRLTDHAGVTYAYDDRGYLRQKTADGATTKYTYDALGSLRSVDLPARKIEYVIDPTGRRIGRRVGGALVAGYLYDGDLELVAELDASGAIASRFVYASRPNVPDSMTRGGAVYRIVSDERGSPRLVVDLATGKVKERLDYDPFGVVTETFPDGAFDPIPFGFAGGLYDRDTKLLHFGARDYDPALGRFLAKDPIGFGGGANLYAYAAGDPVNFVDFDGLAPCGVAVKGALRGGLVGGLAAAASSILDQALRKGCVEWGDVGEAAAGGALGGALWGGLGGGCGTAGPECFAAGTAVATPDGEEAIEELKPGDLVWSRDERTGEGALRPVLRTFVTPDAALVELTIEGERGGRETLLVTAEHPFWVEGARWVAAGELRAGDVLWGNGDARMRVVGGASHGERATVFNVEVEGGHSYFVGRGGAWVHNACEGQEHHAISKKVWRELEKHPRLKGEYTYRDPRLTARAGDLGSHRGYQTWHRQHDDYVVDWIRERPYATPSQFERHLRDLYRTHPDLKSRFPRGLE